MKLKCLLAILAPFLATAAVQAQVTGYWVCNFEYLGNSYPQDMDLVQSDNSISGKEYYTGTTNAFAVVSGTANGNSITMNFDYISSNYAADIVGSYTGNSMTGTWTSNTSQSGTFSCQRTSGGSSTPTPTPTPGSSPTPEASKRKSHMSLFCNRGGVNLNTAQCSATVGDMGAPPRLTPSGSVTFAASNGFFPGTANCLLSPTPYSPGVASCTAEFQVPIDFPIAAKFPIEGVYGGDTYFQRSTTSHELINAGCVGTPENPCSGAVALGFADAPKISGNLIAALLACGGDSTPKKAGLRSLALESASKGPASCNVKLSLKSSVAKTLASIEDRATMGEVSKQLLSDLGAKAFTKDDTAFVQALYDVTNELAAYERAHQYVYGHGNRSQTEQDIEEMAARAIERRVLNAAANGTLIIDEILNNPQKLEVLPLKKKSKKKRLALKAGLNEYAKLQTVVKSNSQKEVRLKLAKNLSTLLAAFKRAEVRYIPLNITLSSVRKGKTPKGAQRKTTVSSDLSFLLTD